MSAFLPFVVFHRLFARLYWFGDDFDQIDLIDRLGFWRWMWRFYGENLVPLFKLLWGSCVLGFGGSYAVMIAIIWLNHALNVVLLGRLMRTCGQTWPAVCFALVVFGLTPVTIETLAFSVEWSVVLSMTFMLAGLDRVFLRPFRWASGAWALASVLSFVKGVLAGPLFALASLLPKGAGPRERPALRAAQAAWYILPSVVVSALIAGLAEGNHRHMAGHALDAIVYGLWYYGLNPLYGLFSVESWGWHTVVVLGLVKIALIVWTLALSRGKQRALFMVLVAFDLANAVLLGVGRFNFGLLTAVSSRYQYASLIGILPLAGFWFARTWEGLMAPAAVRHAVLVILLLALGLSLLKQWSSDMGQWSGWRGTEPRRILLVEAAPGPRSVPGYPGFSTQRAKDLIAKYHLH